MKKQLSYNSILGVDLYPTNRILMIKAIEFVVSLFPTWTSAEEEVKHAAGWAYTHNPFGCDRMKFKSHK